MPKLIKSADEVYLDRIRKLPPIERLLWWIKERESIRVRKEKGEPAPWTHCPILQAYRFTNVRRMDDYVSLWLLNSWYKPYSNHPSMLYAAALARFVNEPLSLGLITNLVFHDKQPQWEAIKKTLRAHRDRGNTVFRASYMVRGNDGVDKVSSVVDYYIGALVKANIEIDTDSMQNTHAKITSVYGFGSFMSGQIVADLRWAVDGLWSDKHRWAPIGPGSKKGMNLTQGRAAGAALDQEQFMEELLDLIRLAKRRLPTELTDRLECIDYQNTLCEIFKHTKALFGEGRPKQRYPGGG